MAQLINRNMVWFFITVKKQLINKILN